MNTSLERGVFHLVLIKPSHYDDDGYPLQWFRSNLPSNSLACVNGLAEDCRDRKVLGDDVEIRITAQDETNSRVRAAAIIRTIRRSGGKGMVALVGVQSNQFPRAVDIARPFLAAGIPVCLGGFHVSGTLEMLKKATPEIEEAAAMGISFFLGEAEDGRMDAVLRDAWAGKLQPQYDFLDNVPGLEGAPVPFLGSDEVARTHGRSSSFDLGRGCPFRCSFCTIINVQGRVSRYRTADDLEKIVRANHAIGISNFFLTDDNLARNKNWEMCFDRLIELRQREGIAVRLRVQVDVLCHLIPGFIDKAVAAGVDHIFIGLENINPDNLAAAKKNQNRITGYREMLLAWKKHPVVIVAGYIIGFPFDTRESILHDVEVIKRELPIDSIYFTNLTPLPGSEDHRNMVRDGIWMDPDLNKYDLNHRVMHHGRMSDGEWDKVYDEVWERYYTWEHMETVLKRMTAFRSNKRLMTVYSLLFYRDYRRLYACHPLEGGLLRIKHRTDRRPGMPLENPVAFYARYIAGEIMRAGQLALTYWRLKRMMERIWTDPKRFEYTDLAMTPPEQDSAGMALYSETRGGAEEVEQNRKREAGRAARSIAVVQQIVP